MSQPHPPPSPGSGEPEYLGVPVDGPVRRAPRWGLLGGAALAVVATVGAGSWGLAQLMAADGSPADAVPGSAVAYVSVDLDPSAGQKLEALTMLRKFPALAEHLDLGAQDDVRRWLFEQLQEHDACPGLTYTDDVEPWLGDRFAVAAVPDDDAPLAPLAVVQVKDQDLAATGLRALESCGASGEAAAGLAFVGEYAVLMEHQDDADAFARAAEASPLSEDADFRSWTGRAGDAGIVNAYLAADGPRLMTDAAQAESAEPDGAKADLFGATRSLYNDFEGAAGVVRFEDGTVEAEMVTRGMPGGLAPQRDPAAPSLAELPTSTAAALTLSFPDGWLQRWTDSLAGLLSDAGPGSGSDEDFWTELEAQTGLQLPQDVETLLGDGLRVSVDGSLDAASLDGPSVPRVPVGVRINGDEAEILRVLDRVRALVPVGDDVLVQRSGDGFVVLGLDPAYVDRLTTDGGLGDEETFERVVPQPDRVSGGIFVDFDAQDWATRLAHELAPGEPDVAANLAPLDGLGLTSWVDDEDVQHGLVRLSTD